MTTRQFIARALTALLLAASAPGVHAQALMQPDELRMRFADSDPTVVLWIGSDDAWTEGHIPSAQRITLGDVAVTSGEYGEPGSVILDLPLVGLDDVRSEFEERGVSDDTDVVVVFGSPRQFTQATRVIWTLAVLGLGDRAFLLDGGQPAWVAMGGELSTEDAGPPYRGEITVAPREELVVGLGTLAREYRSETLDLVDARASASYRGDRPEFEGRAGHIPGAGSLPIETLLDDEGRFRSSEAIAGLLADAQVEGGRVVTYCHIGQRASAAWFAATLAGYDAAIYDGSMNEWARTELPLEQDDGTHPDGRDPR
jgi:thiosulfate/3-mercaptopyruvate sulfurtransferase